MSWKFIVYCVCEIMDLLLDILSVKIKQSIDCLVSKHFSLSKVMI